MLRKTFNATAAAAAIALSLTACGGGGGTSALPSTSAPTTGNPTQGGNANASMTIKIPAKAASSKAQYISASTQSMTIGTVSGTKTTQIAEVDLTPSSKSCSTLAGGGLQCNVTFVGSAGKNVYALSMYDKAGGNGNVLSTGQVSATLTAGQNTNIPIALDGVPVSASVVLGSGALPVGNAGTTSVTVMALDSDSNIIVGPGGFTTPIKLAISGDSNNTLTLSSTSITSPGQAVTLSYSGGSNVGSTITPSIGNTSFTKGAASFNGTGAGMSLFTYTDTADSLCCLYPYDVAAFDNGTAAILFEQGPTYAIGVASPTGVTKAYTGDTTDPYNVPAAGTVTSHGMTVVNGMMRYLETEYGDQYSELGANPDGKKNPNHIAYYSASFNSASAPSCAGGTMYGGVLGKLDTTAGTVTNTVTKGVPMYIQVDDSNNVWFVESGGSCTTSGGYFPSGYAIGELSSSGALTEKDFTAAGMTGSFSVYPASMSITPDGTQMFIGDSSNQLIFKVATSSLSAPSQLALHNSKWPYALATAPDGTTLWFSDNEPNTTYYYGYTDKNFATANEALFPISYFYSYDAAYADGSFWIAGDEYGSGIGRITLPSSGSPLTSYYAAPYPDSDGQYITSISGAGGYVWGTDDEYANVDVLQYGAPGTTTVSYSRHASAMHVAPRNPNAVHHTPHGPHP